MSVPSQTTSGRRITKRVVESLKPGEIAWDTDVQGFGVRCQRASKVYFLKTRVAGRQRWFTIGRQGSPWTPITARREARRLLGDIAAGRDPVEARTRARTDMTVAALCDLYLAEGCATKRMSTLITDRGRIERHVKPLLGQRKVRSVARADVERLLQDVAAGRTACDVRTGSRGRAIVRGGKGTAAKTVTLLGVIFEFAIRRGLADVNPARGVKKFRDKRNERFLSAEEFARLGEVLAELEEAQAEHPSATAAIRLLALTGCRKSEIVSLKWDDVDVERGYLQLRQSKTGFKVVLLGAPAVELLASTLRTANNPYVLPGIKTGTHFVGLQKAWERIRTRAGLEGVRLHDLRHSFASTAAASGDSLVMIGALLGHRNQATTQRYAHLASDPIKAAADRTSGRIAAALMGDQARVVKLHS